MMVTTACSVVATGPHGVGFSSRTLAPPSPPTRSGMTLGGVDDEHVALGPECDVGRNRAQQPAG